MQATLIDAQVMSSTILTMGIVTAQVTNSYHVLFLQGGAQ